CTKSIPPQC
nr:Chain I, 9MER-PEPTIDE [Vigna unguiculata]6EAT_I Chain I, 9MER-PEPTIDE [Vigna unguiculata]